MKYNITHANGTSLVFDDQAVDNKSTSLTFAGQTNSLYSYYFWSNLAHLIENFAGPNSPDNKIVGQLWYDNTKGANALKVYTGQTWQSVAAQVEDMSGYALHQSTTLSSHLILPENPISTATNIAVTRGYIEKTYRYKFKTESTADIKYIRHNNNYIVCHSIVTPLTADTRTVQVLLPYVMADDNYAISLSINSVDTATHGEVYAFSTNKTKTGFTIVATNTFPSIAWVVMGFSE
jgi:hypothetical protein